MLAILLAVPARIGWGGTLGLWKESPIYVSDGLLKTLKLAGWETVVIGRSELTDGKKLKDLDVIFLPGGWNAYAFAGFKARRNLVKFVASGKGIFTGYARTANRPLFPQVGATGHLVNGTVITSKGEGELAKVIEQPISTGGQYHLEVIVGAKGEAFAMSDKIPVGVCSEVYGGRYLLLGALLAMETKTETIVEGTPQQILLAACLDWLASAPKPSAEDRATQLAQSDLEFLRRERAYDWTQSEPGLDRYQGIVPEIRGRLAIPLERRLATLRYLAKFLAGKNLIQCKSSAVELKQAIDELNGRFRKVMSEVSARTGQMTPAELVTENPFVDPMNVRMRIEATPGKTKAEKKDLIALVDSCSSQQPPHNAPKTVAMFLHGDSFSERILSRARLTELVGRYDVVISELQAATQSHGDRTPEAVEKRLRNDPLMMPYYTGNILPTPQKADYREEFLSMKNVAIIVGDDVVNPVPLVEVLTDRIQRYGGAAEATADPQEAHTAIVSLGDTKLASQAKGVPAVPNREQGYVLHATNGQGKPLIVLKGHDRLGLLWAISSLAQLVHWRDGQTRARAATVEDYPRGLNRGYIHSGSDMMFFGPSKGKYKGQIGYDLAEDRQFLVFCKYNMPVYNRSTPAAWNDWKYPGQWPAGKRIPTPELFGQALTPLGINWYASIHPHTGNPDNKLCGDEETIEAILGYARRMEAAGGHLGIILDDVRFPIHPYDMEKFGTAREADTYIITNVFRRLKKEYPKARMIVCPPFYYGPVGRVSPEYGEPRDPYLRMIGEKWPQEIDICWTGQQVNGMPLAKKIYVEWITRLIGRKPSLWQNSAVTWYRAYYYHYGAEAIKTLRDLYWDGFIEGIQWYGFNSHMPDRCIANAIAADFMWNPDAYDPEKSVREAARKMVGTEAWALMREFSEQLSFFDRYANKGWIFYTAFNEDITGMNREAASLIDQARTRLAASEKAYNELRKRFPAAIATWTGLGHFLGVQQSFLARIERDPSLRLYRAAAVQRDLARKMKQYDPERDAFLAACNFKGGLLTEIADEFDDDSKRPSHILDGPMTKCSASFKLPQGRADEAYEVLLSARIGPKSSIVTITINGKKVFQGQKPLTELEWGIARATVPKALLKTGKGDNQIVIETKEAPATEAEADLDNIGEEDDAKTTSLRIQYAVIRRTAKTP